MRRFRFRLQSILDLRRYQEDQQRLELGGIVARCEGLRERIADAKRRRYEVLVERPYGVADDDIGWRVAATEYADRMEQHAEHLARELVGWEEKRREAAERYRLAKRNADILDRLKEKREDQHVRSEKLRAHIALDEVGQAMHQRRTGEGDHNAL